MSSPRLRLLLIEDSLSDAALVVTTVRRQGFDLVYERVDTAEGMLAALDREVWDLINRRPWYAVVRCSGGFGPHSR